MNDDELQAKWDLENHLKQCGFIIEKVKSSEIYAQNLYAALCNNEWQPIEIWTQLSEYKWSCSWRYAGGIIADIIGKGSYLDYYCSGIGKETTGFVEESIITEEIKVDLHKLGWTPIVQNTEIL